MRLRQGDAARSTEYSDDPVAMAISWQERGAERLHLVDLDGAFTGNPEHLPVARSIFSSLRIPVQFGGGVRTLEQIARLLDWGADRVILGTVATDDPGMVEKAVRRHGDSIVVGIDAKDGLVAVRGWVEKRSLSALDLALRVKAAGVRRVIYTDVSRDGTLRGPNVVETEGLARSSGLRIVASGGVAAYEEIRSLWLRRSAGIEGVILGRALYDGKIDFRRALLELENLDAG